MWYVAGQNVHVVDKFLDFAREMAVSRAKLRK